MRSCVHLLYWEHLHNEFLPFFSSFLSSYRSKFSKNKSLHENLYLFKKENNSNCLISFYIPSGWHRSTGKWDWGEEKLHRYQGYVGISFINILLPCPFYLQRLFKLSSIWVKLNPEQLVARFSEVRLSLFPIPRHFCVGGGGFS